MKKLVSWIIISCVYVYFVGVIGESLFGAPFWSVVPDKTDYGFICGILIAMIYDLHDIIWKEINNG